MIRVALALVGLVAGSALAGDIRVERGPEATVTVHSASGSARIDLARDVSGCTGTLYDESVGQTYPGGVAWALLDSTTAGSRRYVLLLGEAQASCELQGQCGGTQDHTLVLLVFTTDMKLIRKERFATDDCRAGRRSRYWHGPLFAPSEIRFMDDVLVAEFSELDEHEVAGRVVYDRKNPEHGLQVTREAARQ